MKVDTLSYARLKLMGNSKYIRPELTELNMSWVLNLVSGSSDGTQGMANKNANTDPITQKNSWGNFFNSRERASMNDGTDVDWDF